MRHVSDAVYHNKKSLAESKVCNKRKFHFFLFIYLFTYLCIYLFIYLMLAITEQILVTIKKSNKILTNVNTIVTKPNKQKTFSIKNIKDKIF